MINKEKVLVVDDQPVNVKLLSALLLSAGYEVFKAYNGEEALKLAHEGGPDVILLDIMMPGMDGYEVTRRLKEDPETRIIPVVLVTALEAVEDKVRGLDAGADEFLSKPVNQAELLTRVRSLAKLKRLQDELRSRSEAAGTEGIGPEEAARPDKETVLIVEDDLRAARMYSTVISAAGYDTMVAMDAEGAMGILKDTRPGVILLDIMLPDTDGLELLGRLKAEPDTDDIPVIMITALSDLETKVKGIETGADDYLVKPIDSQELIARVRASLRKNEVTRKLRSRLSVVSERSVTDPLTGLHNRRYMDEYLIRELSVAKRYGRSFSVMMLDIDHFKSVNDTFGHIAGDGVLKELAGILKGSVRASDLAARFGGEEFLVFLAGTGIDAAVIVAENIRGKVESHPFADVDSRPVTVSTGVTEYRPDDTDMEVIIRRADANLYKAKQSGRNRVVWE